MTTSQEVGVSPNYLSALIKKKTGKSFVDYLTAKRMETARRLLLDTGMKVREIAQPAATAISIISATASKNTPACRPICCASRPGKEKNMNSKRTLRRIWSSSAVMTAMVVGMVTAALLAGMIVFVAIYRHSMIQNVKTSSEQITGQVSNIVEDYMNDISSSMRLIREAAHSRTGCGMRS